MASVALRSGLVNCFANRDATKAAMTIATNDANTNQPTAGPSARSTGRVNTTTPSAPCESLNGEAAHTLLPTEPLVVSPLRS